MKKKILLITVAAIVLFSQACENVEQNVEDYYPRVKTIDAQYLGYGMIEVVGCIENQGTTPIEEAGFCLDTKIPEMLKNQLMASYYQSDTFAALYRGDWPAGKYYLRAWATNENGYSLGNNLSFEIIKTPVSAPCTPTPNAIDFDGYGDFRTFSYTEVDGDFNNFTYCYVDAYNYLGGVHLMFGSRPTTGTYTITDSSPAYNEVTAEMSFLDYSTSLLTGSIIYVNEYLHDNWEIIICEAPWTKSVNNYVTAEFKCYYSIK